MGGELTFGGGGRGGKNLVGGGVYWWGGGGSRFLAGGVTPLPILPVGKTLTPLRLGDSTESCS